MRSDSSGRIRFALALLILAYVLSYVDRTIILLLVGPIRADLHITDTQFSLMQGLAFAVLYTLLGLPLGMLADRGNRRTIIGSGVLLWSVMTAACGFARTYAQLLVARVGVGVGEAALSPGAYSLITDLAPRDSLGRALAAYGAAVYVGIGLTFLGGGWLVDHLMQHGSLEIALLGVLKPWQQVLCLVALPGLALSALILLKLPEPRELLRKDAAKSGKPLSELACHLRERRLFLSCHFMGYSMVSLVFNGYVAWIAEYFVRDFGWTKAQAGVGLGAIILVFGTAGMLGGGIVADRLAMRSFDTAAARAGYIGALGLLPMPLWATLTTSPWVSLAGVASVVFFCTLCFGPAVISLQVLTPVRLRSQVSALYLFCVNLAGIGLGGTAIALISDKLLHSEFQLGVSMAIVGSAAALLAVIFLGAADRSVRTGAAALTGRDPLPKI